MIAHETVGFDILFNAAWNIFHAYIIEKKHTETCLRFFIIMPNIVRLHALIYQWPSSAISIGHADFAFRPSSRTNKCYHTSTSASATAADLSRLACIIFQAILMLPGHRAAGKAEMPRGV